MQRERECTIHECVLSLARPSVHVYRKSNNDNALEDTS